MKLLRLLVLLFPVLANAESISVLGSGTVLVAITSAVDEFKKTTGMDVRLEPRPSADGIFGIAEGKVNIGLTITAVTEAQKQLFPKVDFRSTTVGRGALYLP